jgi:predicted DNA-binding WGR domain protein
MIVARQLLWFYSGSSDKVYRTEVRANGNGTFTLTAFWGRRGKMLQSQEKGTFSTQWAAMRVFHDLLASKRAKGYREVESVPA